MSVYLKNGSAIKVMNEEMLVVMDELPVATYCVCFDDQTGQFYLDVIDDFTLPDRIYGSNTPYAERILNTFESRSGSTGAHLDGIKGSGKTLLSKQISVEAQKRGYPVIVVNSPFAGEVFNRFIQSINTECVILFDEFEKVFEKNELQNAVLTLFDGVYNSKKLFILTTNEADKVSRYMRNRPGRMFYALSFDSLDQSFIQEYLEENLDNKDHIEAFLRYTGIYTFFNFDMLQAVVEEMNRYGESLRDVLEFMNIEPEIHQADSFTVDFKLGDLPWVTLETYHRPNRSGMEYTVFYRPFENGLKKSGIGVIDVPQTYIYEESITDETSEGVAKRKAYEAAKREYASECDEDLEFCFEDDHIVRFDFDRGIIELEKKTGSGKSAKLRFVRNARTTSTTSQRYAAAY